MSSKPLSIAEVFELEPGTEEQATWIEALSGVVNSIEEKKIKVSQKPFWIVRLGDTTGSAEVKMSVYNMPKFKLGDVIEVSGKGIRRTEYQGDAQVTIGKETKINVLGASVHHEEQQERRATSQPAVSGKVFPVLGVTAGMAMGKALAILTEKLTHDEVIARIVTSSFWESVHEVSSDIIRGMLLLESGKLAPSVRERNNPPARAVQPPTAPRNVAPPPRQPTPAQEANVDPEGDSTVPF